METIKIPLIFIDRIINGISTSAKAKPKLFPNETDQTPKINIPKKVNGSSFPL